MIQGITVDSQVYLNGEYLPLSEAKISVLDRGFIFGDGIYEVVPAYNRKPFRLQEHVARLMRSLEKIQLHTHKDAQYWEALMRDMVARSPWDNSFIYLQVTRGVVKRDHAFPNPPVEPTVFLMSSPFTRPSEAERTKGYATVRMEDSRWLHCDIKSVSLLGNVLAKQYAVDHGVNDVIQFRDGFLTEGSSANIWMVKDGVLYAPLRNNLILEGIRYGFMEELAQRCGIRFEARNISEDEVNQADELLLTSATKEILAITQHNGQAVGTGVPGPIYQKLRQAYDEVIAAL